MDEWKRATAVGKLRTFPTCFHTSLMAQAAPSLIRSAEPTRNVTSWGVCRRCCTAPSRVPGLSPHSRAGREQSCTGTQQETPRVFSAQLSGGIHRFRFILGVESLKKRRFLFTSCRYPVSLRHHPGLTPHTIYTHCVHTLHRHISQQSWKTNNTRRGFFDPCEAPSGADME